jgi:hypothetical protein
VRLHIVAIDYGMRVQQVLEWIRRCEGNFEDSIDKRQFSSFDDDVPRKEKRGVERGLAKIANMELGNVVGNLL